MYSNCAESRAICFVLRPNCLPCLVQMPAGLVCMMCELVGLNRKRFQEVFFVFIWEGWIACATV